MRKRRRPSRPTSPGSSDGALAERSEQLDRLFRDHYFALRTAACRDLGSLADAEDVVGNVFRSATAATRRGASLRPAYLYTALRGECARLHGRRDRLEILAPNDLDAHPSAHDVAAGRAWRAEEIRDAHEQIERLRGKLSPRCDEVLQLRDEGYSNAEIAAQLDRSVKTVNAHWQRVKAVARRERDSA